jgi:hypothetical protein
MTYVNVKRSVPQPNQHFPQAESIMAINPFNSAISAARKQMYGNNLGQIVVVDGVEERRIQTGMDTLLAETTFSQRMPAKGQIIAIINRYKRKEGDEVFKGNPPQTVAIFRSLDGEAQYEYGMINLTDYSTLHPYLGFSYVDKPGISEIKINHTIEKDVVFRDSPGVTDEGDYAFSVTCEIAMMGLPGVAEDGIVVSRSALRRFGFPTFEKRVVEFGQNEFPLNLYGDDDNYKIHPNIGEYVNPDGVLMGMRSYRPDLAIAEMSVKACQRIDYTFDRKVVADGEVIDIKMHHDLNTGLPGTPAAMEAQPLKYDAARREFFGEIYRWYNNLARELGRDPELAGDLQRLVVEAISVVAPVQDSNNNVIKVHKKTRIDDYRLEFTIKHKIIPNKGNKFTDLFGGKGVVCHIWEDEDMPVDAHGNRAEMIFDQAAVNNRMIPGRLYEHYINGAARDVFHEIERRIGITPKLRRTIMLQELKKISPDVINDAWEYLLGFYEIVVPKQAAIFRQGLYGATPLNHLAYILSKGYLVMYMRSDHDLELKNMVSDIQRLYPPVFGPIQYRGASGKMTTTRADIRIAPLTIIMLEKIADGWSAVSSTRRQHHGVAATLSNSDKYSERIRNQPTKAYGESEIRIVVSYSGTLTAAEILDRNNSVETHKAMCWSIMNSDKPTRIIRAVDRDVIPLDGSRSLQTVNHVAACGGWEFAWAPYTPTHQPYQYASH